MLGLKRTVIFVDHKIDQVVHECGVTTEIGGVVQFWRKGEMQIAKGCVPCHARQKAVPGQECLQVVCACGNPGCRKADVFIDDRRSLRS